MVFGASLLLLFGCKLIELQVMDNGSGKLFDFYSRLGFERSSDSDSQWMNASAQNIAALVPEKWLDDIVPKGFDVASWLARSSLLKERFFLVKELIRQPKRFHVELLTLKNARVEVTTYAKTALDVESDRSVFVEAALFDDIGLELATAQGNLQFRSGTLRVVWIGRSNGRAAHPSICGCRCSSTTTKVADVTPSVGLLGCLSVVAQLFGLQTIVMQPRDDGRGTLLQYLSTLGFTPPERDEADLIIFSPSRPTLVAYTDDVLARCCPMMWLQDLEGQLKDRSAPQACSDLPHAHHVLPGSVSQQAFFSLGPSATHPLVPEANESETPNRKAIPSLAVTTAVSLPSATTNPPLAGNQFQWTSFGSLPRVESFKACPAKIPTLTEKICSAWPSVEPRSPSSSLVSSPSRSSFVAGSYRPKANPLGSLKELLQRRQKEMYISCSR